MTTLIKTLRLFLTLSLFCLIATDLSAQKSIQEIAELKDKKWDKLVKSYKNNSTWIDQLQGLLNEELLTEKNLPNPKKIGVLTVQIWDKSITTSSKIGNTTLFTSNYLTPAGSNLVADKFLNIMLPIYQEQFKQAGIALLQPKDYLTTESKSEIYRNGVYNVEMSGLSKALRNSFTRMLTGDVKGKGSLSATGYEFYPLSASIVATDFKAPASIGLIAEDLELDAVLVLTINLSLIKNGKVMVLHGIESAIVGPIDDDTSKEYKGRIGAGMMNKYRDGMSFSAVYFEIEPFEIAQLNKKSGQITEWNLNGLDTVTSRMAEDLIVGMKKFIARDKSKK